MLTYKEFAPSRSLERWIQCFWVLKGDAPEGGPEKIFPDGRMEIVVHIGTPFRRIRNNGSEVQSRAFLVGQLTECIVLQQYRKSHVMGVRFKHAAVAAFAPFPLSEIQNEAVTLDSIWGSAGKRLQDDVIEARSDEHRIRLIETFLLRRLGNRESDRRLEAAIRLIDDHRGRITVGVLSESVAWSSRQLEREFLRKVGIGPKAFMRIRRFQSLLQLASSEPAPDWTSLALDSGFFDQAHLIREFKRFSGEPPEMFFARHHFLYEFFAAAGTSDLSNT